MGMPNAWPLHSGSPAALLDRKNFSRRHNVPMPQQELFGARPGLPPGFTYRPQFLGADEELLLLEELRALPFEAAQYRQWQARRRIVAFGGRYDFAHRALLPASP